MKPAIIRLAATSRRRVDLWDIYRVCAILTIGAVLGYAIGVLA